MQISKRCVAVVLMAATAVLGASAAQGQIVWQSTSGDWSSAINWSTGLVPTGTDSAFLGNGGTISITQLGEASGTLNIDNGAIIMSSGGLASNFENVGYMGAGTFIQSGGTHSIATEINLALYPGSTGSYVLSGSGLLLGGKQKRSAFMATAISLRTAVFM